MAGTEPSDGAINKDMPRADSAKDQGLPDLLAKEAAPKPDSWLSDTAKQDVGSSVTSTWIPLLPGKFVMGSPATEACREPTSTKETQHDVTLTNGFEIWSTEVTQGQYKALMGYNPSTFSSCGASCPVDKANWFQAVAYCNELSIQKGLDTCYNCTNSKSAIVSCAVKSNYGYEAIYTCPGYRLPTEAEWEYAYRAGTTTPYYSGSNDPKRCADCTLKDVALDKIGWYCANSGGKTHPVGLKQPNAWGIYDMAGNVREWCHEGFAYDLGSSPQQNPTVPSFTKQRPLRGGSWEHPPGELRAASRAGVTYSTPHNTIGFRCVRSK